MTTMLAPPIDYRLLFAHSPAPMLIVAANAPYYTITNVNTAYLAVTMRPRTALVGRPLFEAMPDNPEDTQATGVANLRASLDRVIATGRPDSMAVQKYDISGPGERFQERWWAPVNAPVLGPAQEVVAIVHHVTDVTQRVQAEAALRGLNGTLEAQVARRTAERDRIWQLSPHLLLVARVDGTILSANPAWERLLGWAPEWLVNRKIHEFKHPAELQNLADELARLGAGLTMAGYEDRFRHRDGSWRWIHWTAEPEGDILYCHGRDVTFEKEQGAALNIAQEALRQSQKMEAVGQLTGGLAHDFNNLLAGISASLEIVESRLQQGRVRELDKYLAAARGATRRAAALTHRLLAFARRQTLDPKVTDVNLRVQGMLEFVQRTVGPGILIEFISQASVWPALVDPSQLENALLNLCINARDAMPTGGRITIETLNQALAPPMSQEVDLPQGEYLLLRVTDSGCGMPPGVVARVFEPFFTTKPVGEGTGLGLSMIYGFAKQSGGKAHIASELGTGTSVSIYLPRYSGAAMPDVDVPPGPGLRALGHGETVLIVDDEATLREPMSDRLRELGYRVLEAADSAAGLAILRSSKRIDLLVSDIGLPGGMSGPQLAKVASAGRPGLKVLFITGYAEHAALQAAHSMPGAQVMTKPFTLDSVASRIQALVEPR